MSQPLANTKFSRPGAGRNSANTYVYVCPVEKLQESARLTRATDLITLINAQMLQELQTPPGILPGRHLRLAMNDIVTPTPDMILPNKQHVRRIIEFGQSWTQEGPLLINCRAGRSRSAAAAFIILCLLNPETPEDVIASKLRAVSASAKPNTLLIELADKLLQRDGRMIEAISAIGDGIDAPGSLFGLPSRINV